MRCNTTKTKASRRSMCAVSPETFIANRRPLSSFLGSSLHHICRRIVRAAPSLLLLRQRARNRCSVRGLLQSSSRANKYPVPVKIPHAIRITRVVDPPCAVTTDCTVDDEAIPKIEEERVVRPRRVARRAPHRDLQWDALPFVFADECLFRNLSG
jgi:hypothetical protein